MMNRKYITSFILCGAAAIIALSGIEQGLAAEKAGDVVSVRGKAVIERQAAKITARTAAAVMESDNVVTRERSRLKMLFRDDSILTLGANSKLVVKQYLYSPESKRGESIYELADGRLRAVVGRSGFKVTTPTAFAAARGTIFTVSYDAATKTTEVVVIEGTVEVGNSNANIAGVQRVTAGQSSTITGERAPTPPRPAAAEAATADGGADLPGIEPVSWPAPGILNDLAGLSQQGISSIPPIEQEPTGVTRVGLGLVFQ